MRWRCAAPSSRCSAPKDIGRPVPARSRQLCAGSSGPSTWWRSWKSISRREVLMIDSQGDLLPYASPETALAHCRRLERRILNIAPEMNKPQLLELLGELAPAHRLMDSIE